MVHNRKTVQYTYRTVAVLTYSGRLGVWSVSIDSSCLKKFQPFENTMTWQNSRD